MDSLYRSILQYVQYVFLAGRAHIHAVFALTVVVLTCKYSKDVPDKKPGILMAVGTPVVAVGQAMHLFRLRPWLWALSMILMLKGGLIVRLHSLQRIPS
jgi:hypothetical protein